MPVSNINSCYGIFEKIYGGWIPSRSPYTNDEHGIGVSLDISPAALGHLVVFPVACVPRVYDPEMPTSLRNKLFTVAAFASRVLEQAYPEAPYVSTVTAGKEIPHAHIHVLPGEDNADPFKRLGKVRDMPRLHPDPEVMNGIYAVLTTPAAKEIWDACSAELDTLGPIDSLSAGMLAAIRIGQVTT